MTQCPESKDQTSLFGKQIWIYQGYNPGLIEDRMQEGGLHSARAGRLCRLDGELDFGGPPP